MCCVIQSINAKSPMAALHFLLSISIGIGRFIPWDFQGVILTVEELGGAVLGKV